MKGPASLNLEEEDLEEDSYEPIGTPFVVGGARRKLR